MKNYNISEILKTLMHYKNVRIVDLVNATSIPQPTLHRIVTGKTKNPKPKYLKIIAVFFNISVEQLKGLVPIEWKYFTSAQISLFSRNKRIPVYTWNKAQGWKHEILASGAEKYTSTDKNVPESAFALEVKDSSMETLFNKGALIIINPNKEVKSGAYVIVKLHNYDEVLFRQIIFDVDSKILKPLNKDDGIYKMRILEDNDIIEGVVVEAKLDCEL